MKARVQSALAIIALCAGVVAMLACVGVILNSRTAALVALIGCVVCLGGAMACKVIDLAAGSQPSEDSP